MNLNRTQLKEHASALLLSLLVLLITFPAFFTHTASSLYFQGIDGTDGAFGDGSLTAWWAWVYSNGGLFKHINPLNSYPWGEIGWTLAGWSQIAFILPVTILSKMFGPVAGVNLGIALELTLGMLACWWAARRIIGSGYVALVAIPIIGFSQCLVWSVGSPSALTSYWPVPILIGIFASAHHEFKYRHQIIAIIISAIGLLSDPFIALFIVLTWVAALITFAITKNWRRIFECLRTFLIFLVLLMPLIMRSLTNTRSDSNTGYARTFEDWQNYGARWWMIFYPSHNLELIGNYFSKLRTREFLEDGVFTRASAQMLFPGFFVLLSISFLVLLVMKNRRSRLGIISPDSHQENSAFILVLILFVGSILLEIIPDPGFTGSRYFPSHILFQISSVWRYTGRLSILEAIAGSIASAVAASHLMKARHKFIRITFICLLGASLIFEGIMPIRSVQYRYLSHADASPAYHFLAKQKFSPYLDVPQFSPEAPFPGAVFQPISKQPNMDRVGLAIASSPTFGSRSIADQFSIQFEALCSPQASAALKYIGIKFVVAHLELYKTFPTDITACGYSVERDDSKFVSKIDSPFNGFSKTLLLRVRPKTSLSRIVIPLSDTWSNSMNESLIDQWTMGSGYGTFVTYQHPTETPVETVLEFDSNKTGVFLADCHQKMGRVVVGQVINGHNKFVLGANCSKFVFRTMDGTQATISSLNSHP